MPGEGEVGGRDRGTPVFAVHYVPTRRDLFDPMAALVRANPFTLILGFFLVPGMILGWLNGDVVMVVLGSVLGIAMLTGWGPAAAILWSIRGRSDLFVEGVTSTVTTTHLDEHSARLTATFPWTSLRRVRDFGPYLVFDFGSSMASILPTRVLDDAQLATLMTLAATHGRIDRQSTWRYGLVGLALGAVATAGLLLLTQPGP